MTVRPDFGPEYGDEERRRFEAEAPPGRRRQEERELHDREREGEEVNYLDPEGNEAHAPGTVCERCGQVITASRTPAAGRTASGCTRSARSPPGALPGGLIPGAVLAQSRSGCPSGMSPSRMSPSGIGLSGTGPWRSQPGLFTRTDTGAEASAPQ